MKVSELTEKSLYIHDKNEKLMAQWALYKSSLIKAATSSKLKIFMSSAAVMVTALTSRCLITLWLK